MNTQDQFKFSVGVLAYPITFVLTIWLVFWVEVRFEFRFNDFGIYPRTLKGLKGLVFSPFIHANLKHLYHNTVPLFVLSIALFYFYRPIAWRIISYGILLSGIVTWIIARPAYHIGASGLIYVLMSFILFKGIFTKHYRLIALSLLVVFLYGSMIWYVFPVKENMSWEGHLSGLSVGLIFALVFKRAIPKPKKYDWEQENYDATNDPFVKHFDESGNFIEILPEIDVLTSNDSKQTKSMEESAEQRQLKINYYLKKSKED
ncbi:MAG: rhomboid family intramembrane serine protease [Flavobacteriaceae bacterium]|nr:rhomboid family intramembrane serine protease [Flavobacteriaceae bacterium]